MTEQAHSSNAQKPARSLKENLQETVEILRHTDKVTLPKGVVIAAVIIALGLIIL